MKLKTFYRDILKKAWKLTLKNKPLCFLGFFAAPLLAGFYNVLVYTLDLFSPEDALGSWQPIVDSGIFSWSTLDYLSQQLVDDPLNILPLLLILALIIILVVFIVWLIIVAQGSLIEGIDQLDNKPSTTYKLNKFISEGVTKFWPLLGINFLVNIITYIIFFLLSVTLISFRLGSQVVNHDLTAINYIIFSVLLIILVCSINFIGKYAVNYLIIEKETLSVAFRRAYYLFINNWLVSLEMSVVMFFVAVFATLLVSVISFFILVPLLLLIGIVGQFGIVPLASALLLLGFLIVIVLAIITSAMVATFQYIGWVLLFKQLHKEEGVASKLVRLFSFK